MEIRTFATALVLIVALNSAAPAGKAGKTITVEGLNQIGDAALIQWALDNVKKNGTVELVGTFALYGTELFVRNNHVTILRRLLPGPDVVQKSHHPERRADCLRHGRGQQDRGRQQEQE